MYGRITVTTNKNATYIFSEGNEKCQITEVENKLINSAGIEIIEKKDKYVCEADKIYIGSGPLEISFGIQTSS